MPIPEDTATSTVAAQVTATPLRVPIAGLDSNASSMVNWTKRLMDYARNNDLASALNSVDNLVDATDTLYSLSTNNDIAIAMGQMYTTRNQMQAARSKQVGRHASEAVDSYLDQFLEDVRQEETSFASFHGYITELLKHTKTVLKAYQANQAVSGATTRSQATTKAKKNNSQTSAIDDNENKENIAPSQHSAAFLTSCMHCCSPV
ncbi:hypothetical protein F4604DRAFT_1918600 [Suillus subluteus]|nr:hypothetical protein F4604DRAFT_1918600 [Suillus subluteus]